MKAAASFLLLIVAGACQSGQNPSSPAEILIATDMPITSNVNSEVMLEQAVDYAIHEQPTIEGYRLGYWSVDDSLGGAMSQLRARENATRIIADRRVLGIVGPLSSFLAKVEMPEANVAQLAMVSPTTTTSCLTVADRPCTPTASALRPTGSNNFFRISPRDPEQGRAVADYAASHLGLRRAAAYNTIGPEGALYVKEFDLEFRKLGGAVVFQGDLPDTTTDFTAFLGRARDTGANAIFAVDGENACKAGAQMSRLIPGAVLLGTDNFTLDPACIGDLGPTPPQVFASEGAVDPQMSTEPAVKKTVAAYLKVHPFQFRGYLGPYVFAAYDCARILIEAIRRAIRSNSGAFPGRAQVVAALTQPPEFVGLTGKYSFDKNGDALRPMMSIYKVDAGQWKFVQLSDLSSS
jgi:branched-chain amino acid transport system substrate-binding protein